MHSGSNRDRHSSDCFFFSCTAGNIMSQASAQDKFTFMPPWSGLSLAGLARSMGQFRGTDMFFRESGDTRATLGRAAETLNGAELDARVRLFSRQMVSLGLVPGERLGIMSLPSCDLVVAIIGAMAAGLTPVLMPLSSTIEQLVQISDDAGLCGIIAGPDMDDIYVATVARNIATRSFKIRTVAGFGATMPEGVVPLANWREGELGQAPVEDTGREPGLITVDMTSGKPVLYHRSQIQLFADSLAFSTAAHVKPRGTILQTMAVASSFFVVSGIVTPLLVRAETRMLPLFSGSGFTEMIRSAGHQPLVVLPAHLESYLVDAQRAFGEHAPTFAFVHTANSATRLASPVRFGNLKALDVTLMGEQGSYSLARTKDGQRAALPLEWQQPGPRLTEPTKPLLVARIDPTGFVDLTGYGCASRMGPAGQPRFKAETKSATHFEILPAKAASLAA
jgi:hypothetical protein